MAGVGGRELTEPNLEALTSNTASDEYRAAVLLWYAERCYEVARIVPGDENIRSSAGTLAHRLQAMAEELSGP